MSGFGSSVWRSPVRSAVAGVVLSVGIASVLYGFNWHSFYDTQRNLARFDARRIAADISDLAEHAGDHPDGDVALRRALAAYSARRKARIRVSLPGEEGWVVENDAMVDTKRTRFERRYELPDGLLLEIEEGIRPSFATALGRAFTFSFADYRADPERWHRAHLYNRSVPLYGYLLTIFVVGFGTIRALHRDQVRLEELDGEAARVTGAFDALKASSAREIEAIRARATETERQRDASLAERERLSREIDAVEAEYGELEHSRVGLPVSDAQLRGIRDRKARIERALAAHDDEVAHYERALGETRSELDAAEELLAEVEVRREDLLGKLRDRNRQIRRLQTLVQEAQRDAHDMQIETMRRSSAASGGGALDERVLASFEEQLDAWVEGGRPAKVSFSKHSRTAVVEAAFESLDRAFVDRWFTHVVNPEYERGALRTIRVARVADDAAAGELVIALDDDAGRSLGLRFETRGGAPAVQQVGVMLAMLCRAYSRELRGYAIKIS